MLLPSISRAAMQVRVKPDVGQAVTPRAPDPRRARVTRLLRERIGENAAQFYEDGWDIIDGRVSLRTAVHGLGHCAREIESSVREVAVVLMVPRDELAKLRAEGERTRATHRLEVKTILAAIGLSADSREADLWLELAGAGERGGLAAITHRHAHERAPCLTDEIRNLWQRFEDLLVVLLREIESRFAAVLPTLRELAAQTDPGPTALGKLRELPNTYVTRRTFFESATPAWFPVLDEAGFFDTSLEPIVDPETGAVRLEHWPAADYLARMSALPEHQERFVSVAERVDPPHEFAARVLMIGARELPLALRERYATALARWLRKAPWLSLIGTELGEFAAALANDGSPAGAAALIDATMGLAPDPEADKPREGAEAVWFRPRPRSRLESYEYERLAEKAFPALIAGDATIAFDLALRLTVDALSASAASSRRNASTHRGYGGLRSRPRPSGTAGMSRSSCSRSRCVTPRSSAFATTRRACRTWSTG